jgi:hypothetical protein
MVNSKNISLKYDSLADRAIDGLFSGLLAGLLMGVVMVLGGLGVGENPGVLLQRFGAGQNPAPLQGAMIHLAVSGVYGVGFSLLYSAIPHRMRSLLLAGLTGLGYGMLLMILAVNVILPGLQSALGELPVWLLATGHAFYGLILGWRTFIANRQTAFRKES